MRKTRTGLLKTPDELIDAYGLRPQQGFDMRCVYLRGKKLKSGNVSLYLSRQESGRQIKRYLDKSILCIETDPSIRERNIETIRIARVIADEANAAVQKEINGFTIAKKSSVNLVEYILIQSDEALRKSGNKHGYYYTLQSLAKHIMRYSGDRIMFDHVDKDYILGFIEYLRTAKNINYRRTKKEEKKKSVPLGQNTQHNLFMKFKYVIKKAMIADIITVNPLDKIESNDKPKEISGTREFLTIEEIKKLIATEFKHDDLKRAFLFCCLVGLRYGDAAALTWGDIEKDNNGDRFLRLRIKKTGREEIFPVSAEALKMLPDQADAADNDPVFSLPKNDHANKYIKTWVEAAGIKKRITFHCSRHTAATLNLSLGTPIETVSKLMGHTKISTTQIYAKIVDENKKAAVNKQNGIFD